MMKPLDNRWLAGYLDGEGSFLWGTGIRVAITNTHAPTLRRLARQYGGAVSQVADRTEQHRTQFQWNVYGDNAEAVVRRALPHLLEKAAQAAIVLRMRATKPGRARNRLKARLTAAKHKDYA
jgi:hypothetical protein